ncbi:GTPase ObgE [Petroclostridium sp. X23]|uniref:GTPase ObgE n=1 Tax=Petroclostridium sp. X23 TaxID=3045146 RepID=UPI0024ADCBB6|nr:GTPase ObgE [Petroclostridium sp. X23]WHH58165.1 GTPase ObgE [Petroclostridium sp. X23]
MFVDHARIYIKAGNGGNGSVSFHREKYVPAGGPDGGDGGKGGDIIFVVDGGMSTLMDFRYKKKYHAQNGEDGKAEKSFGKKGEDLIIKVPPGTVVKDAVTELVIADLVKPGQQFVAAKGGKGGWGNVHFTTPIRQAPKFAKSGEPGEEREVTLELKVLADVGLIGFPNVGKSTVLSVVSGARPKIANYHFTTLNPNLGVVDLGEGNSFVLADIPGLIEGAHEGTGLGHEFLRHIERTRLLVHVVDVSGIEGRDPLLDFDTINRELRKYNSELATKQQIIAANKMDLPGAEELFERFKKSIEARGYKVFGISAATNKGVRELMLYVSSKLKELPPPIVFDAEQDEVKVYKAEEEKPFTVRVEDGAYIVEGKWVQKVAGSTNFDDIESLQYFQRALKKKGVIQELEDMGIQEGDTVKIYEIEFDYVP